MIIYYTDYHNVDEDQTTIASHSGHWNVTSNAGITRRELYSTPTDAADDVASSNMQNMKLYGLS